VCTVSVLRLGTGARIACNRDEQRSRPVALPPALHRVGGRNAAWPTDPAAGGTWVGVNDAGLALTLLNVTITPGAKRKGITRSRGAIIPLLLGCESMDLALGQAGALRPAHHAPFRLVLVNARQAAEVASDGTQLRVTGPRALAEPLLFTSSGLDDDRVAWPRRRLFAERMLAAGADAAAQVAFHRHHWPGREHLSVCMRRPDARTVSCTTVTLGREEGRLDYHPEAPDTPGETFSIRL
jgi:uncharacterized protein with NRDE domain